MKASQVLMLEDDGDRVARFTPVLASIDPSLRLRVWDTAHEMIRDLPAAFDDAVFISLDHDLYTESKADPGDGLDVARFLAEHNPVCPVIIHSSNSPRAQIMTGALELEGWQVARAVPLGEDWIEKDWRYIVSEILASQQSFTSTTGEWSSQHETIVAGLIQQQSVSDPEISAIAQLHGALYILTDMWLHWLLSADGRVIVTDGTDIAEHTDFIHRMSVITYGVKDYPALRKLVPERPRGSPDCECAGHKIFDRVRCPTCGGLRWLFPQRPK